MFNSHDSNKRITQRRRFRGCVLRPSKTHGTTNREFFYHNVVRFSYVHKTFGLCCKFYQVISTRIILEENKEIILVQNQAGSEDRNESAKIAFIQSTEIMQCSHTGWQLAPGLVSHHCRGDTWSRGKLGKG